MRSSVVLLIAVVGGYFAYHLWFAPEEVEQPTAELIVDPDAVNAGAEHGAGLDRDLAGVYFPYQDIVECDFS